VTDGESITAAAGRGRIQGAFGSAGRGIARSVRRALTRESLTRLFWQLCVAAGILLLWEYLPEWGWLSHRYRFLNPFFISSPTRVWTALVDLSTGHHDNGILLWPYLRTTVEAAAIGSAIGLSLGALLGLIFSDNVGLSKIARPFIVLANSVPRIAIIPIFVVLVGPTMRASILNVVAVVFFIGFFNAFEGGCSVSEPVLEDARLLGASRFEVMRSIRLPLVLTWTFAAVPNAISFGIVIAVGTELLAGVQGVGVLLENSTASVQASVTFAIIVALSVVGLLMYWLAALLRDLVIRWD
jgi:NitT/TauT family transport system permease protein